MNVLLVGAGGFLGAIARHLVSGVVQARAAGIFPWGTLAVNVVGCFAMGVLAELAESRGALTAEQRAFAIVGVLGGFTTFSAFGGETLNLARDSEAALAAANIGLHLALGIGAVWAGRAAAHLVWR
jgi:fluoride exporter